MNEDIDLHGVSGALMRTQNIQMQTFVTQPETRPIAFAANQRDEVRDLHDVAGALGAQPGMKQQTFIAEGAGNCLSPCDTQQSGVFPPDDVAPSMSARYETSGNNVPLAEQEEPIICITGNIIDRKPENGGNGMGYNEGVAFTLTATDRHAVFNRQRVDVFSEGDIASTESARQHKDATDLVYQETVGALTSSDRKGPNSQYVAQDKCVLEGPHLIRRLTPLECERLQGFPDGWTDVPGASDSARYKSLGNSVAIPCVKYVMRGIAIAMRTA